MIRRYRILLLTLTGLGVTLASLLLVLGDRYEPTVKASLMKALNERLKVPVSVSGMDLTLIARFPNASLRLRDVLALEGRSDGPGPDTLLYAGDLFLEFSLWDLFRGDHTVERIHASRVQLNPAMYVNGEWNLDIWRSDTTGTSSMIALKAVSFDDLQVRFRDHRTDREVFTHSRSLGLSGSFGSDGSELELQGDVHLIHWRDSSSIVLADRKVQLYMALSYGGWPGELHITKGEMTTGDVALAFTLDLVPGDTGRDLELRANGLELPLAATVALLPNDLAAPLERYGLQGQVDLAIRYAGPMDGDGPVLAVGARISRGRIREKRSGTMLSDVQGDLTLELTAQGVPRVITVTGFKARNGNGKINGNWSSSGLTNAKVKADLQGDIALADLLRFARVDTLEQVQGRLRADARLEGRLRDVRDIRVGDLRTLRVEGTAQLSNATLKLKGVRHRLEHLDADLAFDGNDAIIRDLRGDLQGSTITLKGRLRDLVPYLLFDDQHLVIDAQAASPRIDLATLLASEEADTHHGGYALSLPATIDLDLQARVEELVMEDFRATEITGTVRMKDRVLKVAPMRFHTASGSAVGTLELDARSSGSGGYPLAIDAGFQDIDLTALFREFRDFGQDFIGHRHLSGSSQAHITFRAPLSPDLRIETQAMTCAIDIAVENGAIRGHEPLIGVAEHLRSNKLVSPFVDTEELHRRLADVRFARLENRIEIRNGAVHIPAMEIGSTAMDIELSGTHWFDDRIDHHLNFRLGDLFRMGRPERDEFGPLIDDGTGMRIFLHMHGTVSDPVFTNDGAMAARRRRQQFEQEKQELRSILSDDLGLFKGRGEGSAPPPADDRTRTQVRVEQEPGNGPGSESVGTGSEGRKRKGRPKEDKEHVPRERVVVED